MALNRRTERIPSGPNELKRWVALTEERPEEPHGWDLLAEELDRSPGRRVWIEDVLRELFLERVLGARGSVAVICNIARRCRLSGLGLLFSRYLEEPLTVWSDADVRSLMGALLELAPTLVDLECVQVHGMRPDVFAVAVHVIAVNDFEVALGFMHARLGHALAGARFPERIWDSLAKLFLEHEARRKDVIGALSGLVDEKRAADFLRALARRVERDTNRALGPELEALRVALERAARAYENERATENPKP